MKINSDETVTIDRVELPTTLIRACCPGKTCGSTDLYLSAERDLITGRSSFSYRRYGNDDNYLSAEFETAAELKVHIVDRPEYFPRDDD